MVGATYSFSKLAHQLNEGERAVQSQGLLGYFPFLLSHFYPTSNNNNVMKKAFSTIRRCSHGQLICPTLSRLRKALEQKQNTRHNLVSLTIGR